MVFISETKQIEFFVKGLRNCLGLNNVLVMSGKGKGGGLALFWDDNVTVELKKLDPHFIDVNIVFPPFAIKWRCTFVYGEARVQDRHLMWDLMRKIKPLGNGPWLMIGDFNETMWQHEHFSTSRRKENQMRNFREVLSDCNLHDLGYNGLPWTYDNKQHGSRNVKSRIDRAVACRSWSNAFPEAFLKNIASFRSDHLPLHLSLFNSQSYRKINQCHRYEAYWEREPSLNETVKEAWARGGENENQGQIASRLKSVMTDLKSWSKHTIGSVPKKLDKYRKRLEILSSNNDPISHRERRKVHAEMEELLQKEEMLWRKRSRALWLKEGDNNTSYFHRKASWRANKNRIVSLQDNNGQLVTDEVQIGKRTNGCFTNLFTKDDSVVLELIIDQLQMRVNEDMNSQLCKEFSNEEISDALFQIGPLKAPGPDGFPASFFKKTGTF